MPLFAAADWASKRKLPLKIHSQLIIKIQELNLLLQMKSEDSVATNDITMMLFEWRHRIYIFVSLLLTSSAGTHDWHEEFQGEFAETIAEGIAKRFSAWRAA